MRVLVVTPPAPLVTLAEAKAHLRVDAKDEDTLISIQIAAASAMIDGPSGSLGRAVGLQTLEYRGEGFPGALPCPQAVSIESVKYLDGAGVEQIVAEAGYDLVDNTLWLRPSALWVAIGTGREWVRVRYVAGYAACPAPIKAAVLLMVGDLYANRQSTESGSRGAGAAVPMSTTVELLLAPYRVWL